MIEDDNMKIGLTQLIVEVLFDLPLRCKSISVEILNQASDQ